VEAFGARGFTVETAASDWVVRGRGAPTALPSGSAGPFLTRLVEGRTETALAGPPGEARRVSAWSAARAEQIARGGLHARIGHRDVLALPAAG
jgi:hypothetical protein